MGIYPTVMFKCNLTLSLFPLYPAAPQAAQSGIGPTTTTTTSRPCCSAGPEGTSPAPCCPDPPEPLRCCSGRPQAHVQPGPALHGALPAGPGARCPCPYRHSTSTTVLSTGTTPPPTPTIGLYITNEPLKAISNSSCL